MQENEITLDTLRAALDKEETVGWSRRIRRKKEFAPETNEAENWDVLGHASRRMGRYFVVKTDTSDKKE